MLTDLLNDLLKIAIIILGGNDQRDGVCQTPSVFDVGLDDHDPII